MYRGVSFMILLEVRFFLGDTKRWVLLACEDAIKEVAIWAVEAVVNRKIVILK